MQAGCPAKIGVTVLDCATGTAIDDATLTITSVIPQPLIKQPPVPQDQDPIIGYEPANSLLGDLGWELTPVYLSGFPLQYYGVNFHQASTGGGQYLISVDQCPGDMARESAQNRCYANYVAYLSWCEAEKGFYMADIALGRAMSQAAAYNAAAAIPDPTGTYTKDGHQRGATRKH